MYKISIKNHRYQKDIDLIVKNINSFKEIVTPKLDVPNMEIEKERSLVWRFSTKIDTNLFEVGGFIIDIDQTSIAHIPISKRYELYLHKTHRDRFRLILPFDVTVQMNKAQYKSSFVQAMNELNIPSTEFDECSKSLLHWYVARREDKKLLRIKGETYHPVVPQIPTKASGVKLKSYNWKPIENLSYQEACTLLLRINAFYEYYKTKINWRIIKNNSCQTGLHDKKDKDISFNEPSLDNGYEANIYCYHTSCYDRLRERIGLAVNNDKIMSAIKNYTVLYLFLMVIENKLHLHQVEMLAVEPKLWPYLERLQNFSFDPKIDAPLWVRYLHDWAIVRCGLFYEYKDGVYNEVKETDMKHIYNYTVGTYICYRTGKKKSDTYINEMLNYVVSEAHHNNKIVEKEGGLAFKNTVMFLEGKKLTFHKHSPKFFITKKFDYDYNPNAKCPLWKKCLSQWFPKKEAVQIQILQEYFGYCLTYDQRFEKFLIIFGKSRGGKNTIAEVLLDLLGGSAADIKANLVPPKERSFMVGEKVLYLDETMECRSQNTVNILKKIVSTGPLDIRPLWAQKFDLYNKPKLFFTFNKPPDDLKIDNALRNRMLTLKATVTFEKNPNVNLKTDLKKEYSGILNWAIEGYNRLYENGKFTSYDDATRELYEAANECDTDLEDFLRTLEKRPYTATELRQLYVAETQDFKSNDTIGFGGKMRRLGYKKKSCRINEHGVDVVKKCYVIN